MSVSVRPLRTEDRAEWGVLWKEYLNFYETTVSDAMYDLAFSRMLTGEAGEFRGHVAISAGKLVGLVHFLFHRHGWREEDVVYLQDLYVGAAARGSGAGRALIESVYQAADAAGSSSVYWLTQDFNATARQLYDRIGVVTPFVKYQRVPA